MTMSAQLFIPSSLRDAACHLRDGWRTPPALLSPAEFVRVWSSVAYLYPGLHPDGFEDAESGWPRTLKRFAADAWRRVENAGMNWKEHRNFYPSDAQWAGLFFMTG